MLTGLRIAYLLAAVVLLVILPIAESTVILALFVAVDLAAAALLLSRPAPPAPPRKLVALGDDDSVKLFRRTVPELRSRRPAAIIEAQVAWRQAAEFRRRRSVPTRRPS